MREAHGRKRSSWLNVLSDQVIIRLPNASGHIECLTKSKVSNRKGSKPATQTEQGSERALPIVPVSDVSYHGLEIELIPKHMTVSEPHQNHTARSQIADKLFPSNDGTDHRSAIRTANHLCHALSNISESDREDRKFAVSVRLSERDA